MVYAFCFQVPFWMQCSPMGVQPLVHARNVLSGCSLHCFESRGTLCYSVGCPTPIPIICWGIELSGLGRVTWSLCIPYMVGRGNLFVVWFHLMTKSSLNLWWALIVLILVWWLVIRLMSVLASGTQGSLLLIHTFTLGSQIRCCHLTTFHLSQGVRIIPF